MANKPKASARQKKIDALLAEAKALPWYYVNTKHLILKRAMHEQIAMIEEDLPAMLLKCPMVSRLFDAK